MVSRMQSEADVAAESGSPPTPDPAASEEALQEMKDRWLRAAADLENMRKRSKREIEDARIDAKNEVLREMLPVVDNLERAIAHAGGEESPVIEGVRLVFRQFQTAFERLQIHAIDALGTSFDPTQHEAISQEESDQPPGTVVQVLQRGYRTGDRLLRPALVVVARAR
jgi:molecular chaperone GrpE